MTEQGKERCICGKLLADHYGPTDCQGPSVYGADPQASPEIDAQFAPMATDKEYQKEALELAEGASPAAGPCSSCGDGDVEQKYHTHDGVHITATLIYHVFPVGLTIECEACVARLLYGALPRFCAACGGKFTKYDDSKVQTKDAPGAKEVRESVAEGAASPEPGSAESKRIAQDFYRRNNSETIVPDRVPVFDPALVQPPAPGPQWGLSGCPEHGTECLAGRLVAQHFATKEKPMAQFTAFVVEKEITIDGKTSRAFVGASFDVDGAAELVRLDRIHNPHTVPNATWYIREYESEKPAAQIIQGGE